MSKTVNKNISQPEDHWPAWQHAAARDGMTLAAWMAKHCNAALPKRVSAKLSERRPAHRPLAAKAK